MGQAGPWGGAFGRLLPTAVTVNRNVCPLHTPLNEHLDGNRRKSTSRPPGSMPPTQTKGKDRAGAGQDSEPTPYAHHLSTVLINLCVRHSYFIMWRARVQVRRQRRRSRRRRARQSRLSRVRRKVHASRPARPWPGAWPSRQEAPSTRSSPTLASRPMVQAMK